MAARLDTLRPELETLLHDAAVVGRVFWGGAVAAIGERDRGEVRLDLNELVRREFVRPVRASSIEGEDEFSFWHALVRDVAYQQIPRSPRAEKHLATARWVEHTAEERVADHSEILVHHYGEALELTQAAGADRPDIVRGLVRFLLLACDRALQLDPTAAERDVRRALALSEGNELTRAAGLAKLGEILQLRGEFDDAVAAYEAALSVFRTHGTPRELGEALFGLGATYWTLGRIEEAQTLSGEAVRVLEAAPGPELVNAYGRLGLSLAISNRFEEAEPFIEKGLALAAKLGVENVSTLLQARASVLGYNGSPEALTYIAEAIDLCRRLGLGRSTVVAMNNHADGLGYFVGLRQARAQWDETVEFARSRGIDEPMNWARSERLRALFHLGEWDELRGEAEEILQWALSLGGAQHEAMARSHLAVVLAHVGDVERATHQGRLLSSIVREIGDPQLLVPGLAAAAVAEAARRDDPASLLLVRELDALTRGSPIWRDFCLVWPARIAIAAGEPELAAAFLDAPENDAEWSRCARLTASAMLAEARGDRDEASALYREVAERWDAYGSVVERAYALLGLGRCGDPKALVDGQAIFSVLGASPVLAKAA